MRRVHARSAAETEQGGGSVELRQGQGEGTTEVKLTGVRRLWNWDRAWCG